jgi:hypothetical protein
MRVLITNNTLANRAGSELYVRDLALALMERGHTPIAYSTILGDVAEELRESTVPVIDDLRKLGAPPDIIHGQHHLETMSALLQFPGVPAIYLCHGWRPWEEVPPLFPRILRYIAVDTTCWDRIVLEHGIPEERARTLLNFVDLERFEPRGPLPRNPRRALLFSNDVSELNGGTQIQEACRGLGISVDIVGLASRTATSRPEAVLREYDIVFAKGRSALEALAVGAAVVLFGYERVGPMVTNQEFDHLRSMNFGVRAIRQPMQNEDLIRELLRYDPQDAAEVSRRVRATASRERTIDELVALYTDVIEEYCNRAPVDPIEEWKAASAYCRSLSPRLKERDGLCQQVTSLNQQVAELTQELASTQADLSRAQSELVYKQEALARIKQTLGWRLLSIWGPVKYRALIPAWNRMKKIVPW